MKGLSTYGQPVCGCACFLISLQIITFQKAQQLTSNILRWICIPEQEHGNKNIIFQKKGQSDFGSSQKALNHIKALNFNVVWPNFDHNPYIGLRVVITKYV